MLLVTSHAVDRYRHRCTDSERKTGNRAIRQTIIDMAESPDSLKFVAGGKILVKDDWILIQAENRIVTLYKGDERDIVRKKVRGKRNVSIFDTSDAGSGDESIQSGEQPASRLDRVKSLFRRR
jgi:hypothetical protein